MSILSMVKHGLDDITGGIHNAEAAAVHPITAAINYILPNQSSGFSPISPQPGPAGRSGPPGSGIQRFFNKPSPLQTDTGDIAIQPLSNHTSFGTAPGGPTNMPHPNMPPGTVLFGHDPTVGFGRQGADPGININGVQAPAHIRSAVPKGWTYGPVGNGNFGWRDPGGVPGILPSPAPPVDAPTIRGPFSRPVDNNPQYINTKRQQAQQNMRLTI